MIMRCFTLQDKQVGSTERRYLMEKWECLVCGYIYDPELGDPDNNVEPETPFEELPDEWVCPDCGAEKEEFEKMEE